MNPNHALTEAVARRLGPLLPEFVFTGGCATGLLMTGPASTPPCVTRDVDVIAEVPTYGQYSSLGDRLRDAGFLEDGSEGAPICRWVSGDLILDVMPSTNAPLGFTNEWYAAIPQARWFELAPDLKIRLISGPLFLATKLVAFQARGNGEYYVSQDMEDIVSVIDGRPELPGLENTDAQARSFLAERFAALLEDDDFLSWLPGNFPGGASSQGRVPIVLARIRSIAG